MVSRQPGLLTHLPTTLSIRLRGVAELLQVESGAVGGFGASHLVEMEPGLLTFRHEDLEARLKVQRGSLPGTLCRHRAPDVM